MPQDSRRRQPLVFGDLCGFTPSGLARTAQFTDAVLALVRQALQSQAARLQHMEGIAASMGVRMAQLADDHKATGPTDTQ